MKKNLLFFFLLFLLNLFFSFSQAAGPYPASEETGLPVLSSCMDLFSGDEDSDSYKTVDKNQESSNPENNTINLNDSPDKNSNYPRTLTDPYKFKAKDLIAPAILIGLGSLGLSGWWKEAINVPIKDKLTANNHKDFPVDNFTLWVPAAVGYGMNLFGFKGKHNIADATIIYATAYILCEASTFAIKYSVSSMRPNFKNDHSFPSGHTAIAFCGAELLRQEYNDVSPWIGVGGYAVAALTGFMRMYNNAHWFNDVLAGAGLGILCAKTAYWLYPVITKTFFKKRYQANVFLAPAVSKENLGVACAINF